MAAAPATYARLGRTFTEYEPGTANAAAVKECRLNADASLLAVPLSSGGIHVLDAASLRPAAKLDASGGVVVRRQGVPEWGSQGHIAAAADVAWCDATPALLYAVNGVGQLQLFDTRAGGRPAAAFEVPNDDAAGEKWDESVWCAVAVNPAGDTIAVGSGAHILFYDVRALGGASASSAAASSGSAGGKGASSGPRWLGHYTDSHSETVTQLLWHPVLPRHLLSGGEDGMICAFDTSIAGEEEALVTAVKVGSGVARLGVFGPAAACVYVLNTAHTLSLYNIGTAERIAEYPYLVMDLQAAGVGADYLLGCHYDDGSAALQLLAGSYGGDIHVLDVQQRGVALKDTLSGAHTGAVNCAAFARVRGGGSGGGADGTVMFTGGDDGNVVQWADAAGRATLTSGREGGVALGSGAHRRAHAMAEDAGGSAPGPVYAPLAWRRELAYARSGAPGGRRKGQLPGRAGGGGAGAAGGAASSSGASAYAHVYADGAGGGGSAAVGDEACDADAFGSRAIKPGGAAGGDGRGPGH